MRIEARALGRRFGEVRALADVSFDIPPGRRVALIGPNGSGKSTLNRILMGLLRYEGEVRLDGFPPLGARVAVAPRIAYVPQTPPRLGVPVGEMLRAIQRVRGTRSGDVEKLAEIFDLDLAEVADRAFRSLSGGTQQKLLISIALANEVSLLILDEPTGGLDARSRESFFRAFDALAGGATVVLCSHRLEEIRQLVDHVLMLAEGRLVHDGPAEGFLAASTRSLVEVCVEGDAAGRWLARRGFRRGTGSWWVLAVTHAEKLDLLSELGRELGGQLRDLNVRDLESLDLRALDRPEAGVDA